MSDNYNYLRDATRYSTWGTYLSAAGTLLSGTSGKIIKVHQYSISAQGSIVYSLNDAKPMGGTIDYGGFIAGQLSGGYSPTIIKPFIPYPNYLCKTSSAGSALCLGTYLTAPTLGTVYFQCLYTASDSS